MPMTKKVLILHAPGTNRDGDLAEAIRLAGGDPDIVPLSRLGNNGKQWREYAMLALPGGFSYGDALGAGRLWALELETAFEDLLQTFAESNRPVIGICNGFQMLVKAGNPTQQWTNCHTYFQRIWPLRMPLGRTYA